MRFAHMADCHIGAWRESVLREKNIKAFEIAMDRCMEENVDFILIAGDLFNANIPDMSVVDRAVRKMKEVHDRDIPIYVIYGSHDYSPNMTSMIDILYSAGLFEKVVIRDTSEGVSDKIVLKPVTDPKTKASIVGLSARRGGLEEKYYEMLDCDSLEELKGFKIFMFHSAITKYKPKNLAQMSSIPLSLFPKGFTYYAGGHVHKRMEADEAEYGTIIFPGPLFGADFRDLEGTSKGEKKGFYLVEVKGSRVESRESRDEGREFKINTEFIEINVGEVKRIVINADNRSSDNVSEELFAFVNSDEIADKIVLIKVGGTLSTGAPGDIDFTALREQLLKVGAQVVSINRYALRTQEQRIVRVTGESKEDIESKLFEESLAPHTSALEYEWLKPPSGLTLAENLLRVLKEDRKDNEKKQDYEERMMKETLETVPEEVTEE